MKNFNLPDLGEGLPDAEIHEWNVKEGDKVKTDDILVSVETAKALVEIPAPYSGTVEKLYGKTGDTIKTGEPLVGFVGEKAKTSVSKEKGSVSVVGDIKSSEQELKDVIATTTPTSHSNIKASPAVKSLAKKLNVELAQITPSNPNGIITIADVENYNKSSTPSDFITLTGTIKNMATNMASAFARVVPVTVVDDANIDINTKISDLTVKTIRAIVEAVKIDPSLNAWFDRKSLSKKTFEEIHLGIAVDSPHGLFVPVIKSCHTKTDAELRTEINRLKIAVKDRTLSVEDMQKPTFTLTNFGVFAGKYATPIIVPPSVAILGIGKSREAIISANKQPIPVHQIPISLTFDHQSVTGGESARFLKAIINSLAS